MSNQARRNLLRREQRKERVIESWSDPKFCGVCHYGLGFCRCAGARLFLHAEVLRLQTLLSKPLPRTARRGRKAT